MNIINQEGRASAGSTEMNIPDPVYRDGHNFLEEVLIHEGAHVTIQDHLYNTPRWLAAVEKDNKFVTKYATTHVNEDLAESYLAWFAVRYEAYRTYDVTDSEKAMLDEFEEGLANRFVLFDELSCQPGMMSPWPDCHN